MCRCLALSDNGIYHPVIVVLASINDVDALVFGVKKHQKLKTLCLKLQGGFFRVHGFWGKMIPVGDGTIFSCLFGHVVGVHADIGIVARLAVNFLCSGDVFFDTK